MGSITDYLEAEWLDHVFNSAYSSPVNIYLCLCTADPTDAATGASMNEVANAYAYQRTAISFGVAASRVVTQDADVDFPQASGGGWGAVTHWAIADSQTYGAGNVLACGAFGTSKTINDGNTPTVSSGEINVTVTASEMSDYLANELLDHTFNNSTYTSPAGNTFVAMTTATISASDTGSTITEPSGNGYARTEVNPNGGASPTWDLATGTSPCVVDNTHAVQLGPASGGNWGTLTSVAILDASTLGNLLFFDNTMTDQAVDDADTAEFAIGVLDIQLT